MCVYNPAVGYAVWNGNASGVDGRGYPIEEARVRLEADLDAATIDARLSHFERHIFSWRGLALTNGTFRQGDAFKHYQDGGSAEAAPREWSIDGAFYGNDHQGAAGMWTEPSGAFGVFGALREQSEPVAKLKIEEWGYWATLDGDTLVSCGAFRMDGRLSCRAVSGIGRVRSGGQKWRQSDHRLCDLGRRSGPTPACAGAMPSASQVGHAPAAPKARRSPASRYAGPASTSAVPPTAPAVPGPGARESRTAAGIPISAAAPTAPGTGGAAGSGVMRGSAPIAAATLPRTAAPSASLAARQDARSTAGAMPRAELPVPVCAAQSRRSAGRRAVPGTPRWRRNGSPPNAREPSIANAMPGAGRRGVARIVASTRPVPHAVPPAPGGPIRARPRITVRPPGRPSTP